MQDIVGHLEGIGEGGLFIGDAEQVLIGNDDQRIHMLLKGLDPLLGDAHATGAFELERLGDDAHGQNAQFTGGLGDHRRRAGAGAAAHARRDEGHVAAFQVLDDLIQRLLGGALADLRARSGAQPLGQRHAKLNPPVGLRLAHRLGIGVGDHEFRPFQAGADHIVDGIAAGATDAENHDARFQFTQFRYTQINGHSYLP